jgi:nicotinamide-nucleotide amidase
MFDDDVESLAKELVRLCVERGVTVGTAESCTGGLVSGAVTSVPGSSEAILGGVVSYACSVKRSVLGVSQTTLDTVGAVSSECACEMAEGARRVLGCDVAVSVTGIAGPGGEEPSKPVGTVWFGLATPIGVISDLELFDGDRDDVRRSAVAHALGMLHDGVRERTP